jgi:hypothetical protein
LPPTRDPENGSASRRYIVGADQVVLDADDGFLSATFLIAVVETIEKVRAGPGGDQQIDPRETTPFLGVGRWTTSRASLVTRRNASVAVAMTSRAPTNRSAI